MRIFCLILGIFLTIHGGHAFSAEIKIFGPRKYTLSPEERIGWNESFIASRGEGTLIIEYTDGALPENITVVFNGEEILGRGKPTEWGYRLELGIELFPHNSLRVKIGSVPGASVTITARQKIDTHAVALFVPDCLSIEVP